jgi:hypothetical protein
MPQHAPSLNFTANRPLEPFFASLEVEIEKSQNTLYTADYK